MVRGRGELTPNDIEIRKIISNNINSLLVEQNKKQTDIHLKTGIPKSTLTGYVKGTSTPNQGNIQKLADFFGVKKSKIDPRFSSIINAEEHTNSPPYKLIPLDEKLGAKITELAKEKDISDDAMAKFIGIGMDDIEEYKAGKKPFSVNMVFNFAMALGVTFDDLFPEDIEYDKIPAITKVDNEHNCIMTADGSKYQLTDDEMQRVNNLLLFKNRQ